MSLFRSLIFFLLAFKSVILFPDVGMWDMTMSGEKCEVAIKRSLFKGSKVHVRLHCQSNESRNITVVYEWRPMKCLPDYFHFFEKTSPNCSNEVNRVTRDATNETSVLPRPLRAEKIYTCENKHTLSFEDHIHNDLQIKPKSNLPATKPLLIAEKDGIYYFQMRVCGIQNYNVSVNIKMISADDGFLSAVAWPFIPFFGVMCGVYTVLCAGWLLVCWLQWRDLLRIQYWIGGVALLGMVESATYYAIYASIDATGAFSPHAYLFAEWLSVCKRALARMLVIIVSLGFGIVKPRLGPALQRVLATGLLWCALALLDSWLRLHRGGGGGGADASRSLLLSQAPLALLDSAICWWVFVSLAHTMRTLQLRRNTIKFALYRHFTNTLIFAVISSVIFMLYSIRNYRMISCIINWREVWMDDAYWHILFACVLSVIMILWRPTNNNQRYAFTPLLDNADDDDDEEEQFVNDAYGVKMRNSSVGEGGSGGGGGGAGPDQPPHNTLDADLRWVEENIPASTLPLLDSDEEIINTKFEVSKMQ